MVLHGLADQNFNGREGMVVWQGEERAEIRVAGLWKVIKVRWGNLKLMPTYVVSKFKRGVQVVSVCGRRDPVAFWPEKLTGTHYQMLRVSPTADLATIKAAYTRLSVQLHPDKNLGHGEKAKKPFQQVNEAYKCLANETSRRDYDRSLMQSTGGPSPATQWRRRPQQSAYQ